MDFSRNTYFAHFIGIFAICMAGPALHSCSDEMDLPGEDEVAETVIIYMSAENSLVSYAKNDLQEMYAAVDSIPDSCQVIVYFDGELAPAIYKLTTGSHVTWREYKQDQNSADSTVMATILKDIVRNFPSKHYSLVLWGHGTGWQYEEDESARNKAILVDNNKNITEGSSANKGTWLQATQLKGVLSVLPKLDYLMQDLCFGQNIETVYEVKDKAEYIIGSPAEIPANGAPYGKIMRSLCIADIGGIVSGYADYYGRSKGCPLSAIKASEIDNLATATASVLSQIFPRSNMPVMDSDSTQQYAPDWGTMYHQQMNIPVPYDMRSAIYRAAKAKGVGTAYDIWDVQWRKTVMYATAPTFFDSQYGSNRYGSYFRRLVDPDHFGGVSMNIPHEEYEVGGYNSFYHALSWYKAAGWDKTGW